MTKEELAKKRGIVVSKEAVSPSDALVTTKPAPAKKTTAKTVAKKAASKKNPVVKKAAPAKKSAAKPKAEAKTAPVKAAPNPAPVKIAVAEKPKNKGGRPKTRTEEVKILNIAIPLSVYNNMNDHAVALFGNNMTEYINSLIKKDLDINLDNYKKISAMMKKAIGN